MVSMPTPEDAFNLDRMIHEPGRLAILTVLSSVKSTDFTFLLKVTGLTKGNLSSHLSKLEDAGLLTIDKRFVHKKSHTTAALTPAGRDGIEAHWRQLDALKDLAKRG
ncbi:Regulatory protein, ArsR [metagenome]|uniref:Regulatory protein, ArsR n=1 Tax=metagenome TaxID=256318 RepID=A0A2P2BZI3_9ZZZZ